MQLREGSVGDNQEDFSLRIVTPFDLNNTQFKGAAPPQRIIAANLSLVRE